MVRLPRCKGCEDALRVKERQKDSILSERGCYGVGVRHGQDHQLIVYGLRGPRTIEGIQVQKVRSTKPRIHGYSAGDSVATFSKRLDREIDGSIGLTVWDASGNPFLVSNNHTFTGIDTVENPTAEVGQSIMHPASRYGTPELIATLAEWMALTETGRNKVDAAIATPTIPSDVNPDIRGIGIPAGAGEALPGMSVMKSGASTGVTESVVLDTNASLKVNYDGLFDLMFDEQIVIEGRKGFSEPGDSGAAVVNVQDDQVAVVGLLFAGSDSISMASKIGNVSKAFGFEFPQYVLTVPRDYSLVAGAATLLAGAGLVKLAK